MITAKCPDNKTLHRLQNINYSQKRGSYLIIFEIPFVDLFWFRFRSQVLYNFDENRSKRFCASFVYTTEKKHVHTKIDYTTIFGLFLLNLCIQFVLFLNYYNLVWIGHVDFYMNDGQYQPGCTIVSVLSAALSAISGLFDLANTAVSGQCISSVESVY